jgi:hypothetical protein
MAVTLICPNLQCSKTMVADDALRGKVVRCVHCQKPLLVPQRREGAMAEFAAAASGDKKKPR